MELKKMLKNRNNRLMLGIFIIGVVIILLSALFDNDSAEQNSNNAVVLAEEERLSMILSEINGAGRVSVMISYETANDSQTAIGRGLYDSNEYEKPLGVIVVADGAVTPSVKNNLKEAAVAITGVGANRVCVYPR